MKKSCFHANALVNVAFVIDSAVKERLCAQDPRSADLLKPFLEGKDLQRWRAEPRGLWLIYIPKNRGSDAGGGRIVR